MRARTSLERRTRASVIVLGDGAPVVLRGTGVDVWDAFATARSVADAAEMLATAYATSPDIVEGDLLRVAERLCAAGVLTHETAGSS